MKKIIFFLPVVLLFLTIASYAQDKKVAVVSFYVNKKLNVTELGGVAFLAVNKLIDDPNFDMKPLLNKFHKEFFENYSKGLPFQLLPEDQVTNNAEYKAFVPVGIAQSGVLEATKWLLPVDGYQILLQNLAGHSNEEKMAKMFSNQADGILDVSLNFKLIKIGLGGMGVVKMKVEADISLFNKNGDKVFHVNEYATSKSVSALVGGVPVMTPENILPMCESATDKLVVDLKDDLPKMIKKSNSKL